MSKLISSRKLEMKGRRKGTVKRTETTESSFRYGEIEEELYSDIVCDGGLSFTAKILNASERRREFRAADFAAQVGSGVVAGSRRQRVTMCAPLEFAVVTGALKEGVEIDRDIAIFEMDVEANRRVRGHAYRKHKTRTAEGRTRTERTHERTQRTRTDKTTTVEEITPVPPVPPISPIVMREIVTNEIVRTVPVAEGVAVRVVSLDYSPETQNGILIIEIIRGSFKNAAKYIRKNFDDLVRKKSPAESAARIPVGAKLKIESITIDEDDCCKVKFSLTEEKQ